MMKGASLEKIDEVIDRACKFLEKRIPEVTTVGIALFDQSDEKKGYAIKAYLRSKVSKKVINQYPSIEGVPIIYEVLKKARFLNLHR